MNLIPVCLAACALLPFASGGDEEPGPGLACPSETVIDLEGTTLYLEGGFESREAAQDWADSGAGLAAGTAAQQALLDAYATSMPCGPCETQQCERDDGFDSPNEDFRVEVHEDEHSGTFYVEIVFQPGEALVIECKSC